MSDLNISSDHQKLDKKTFRKNAMLCFGLFLIFFIYYISCAIIQTPGFQDISSIPLMGMPLGFVLSMGVFPVSWILLIIFFIFWR